MRKLGLATAVNVLCALALLTATTMNDRDPNVFAGRVISAEDSSPIEGALISIRSGRPHATICNAVTKSDGTFRLSVATGPISVWASVSGYQTFGRSGIDVPSAPLTVRLRSDRPLSGVVVDSSGDGIGRARVRLLPQRPGVPAPILEVLTKRDGSYMVRGIDESSSYRVQIAQRGALLAGVAIALEFPSTSLPPRHGGSLSLTG